MEVCYLAAKKIVKRVRRSKASAAAPVGTEPGEVNRSLDDEEPYQLLFPLTSQKGSSSSTTRFRQARPPGTIKLLVTEEEILRLNELGINLRPRVSSLKECAICTENFPPSAFISTQGCAHEYCRDCSKRHAEAKLTSGSTQIQCPHPKCTHTYDIRQLTTTLLSPSQMETLNMRLTEAAIPASLRVYCPVASCSAFMEKSEVDGTYADCVVCEEAFCQSCNVPWHSGQSCVEFRAHEKNAKLSGDQKLLDLAITQKWKHCPKCGRLVERTTGCRHMTCLCKNEFCYLCGMSYVNKLSVCDC